MTAGRLPHHTRMGFGEQVSYLLHLRTLRFERHLGFTGVPFRFATAQC